MRRSVRFIFITPTHLLCSTSSVVPPPFFFVVISPPAATAAAATALPLGYRFLTAWVCLFFPRCKYYVAWLVSEGSANLAGFG